MFKEKVDTLMDAQQWAMTQAHWPMSSGAKNVGNQHFLLFSCLIYNLTFRVTFSLPSADTFNFGRSKIVLFSKELTQNHNHGFYRPRGHAVENIDGKAADFGSQLCLLFTQCFPEFQWQILPI